MHARKHNAAWFEKELHVMKRQRKREICTNIMGLHIA